jgi:hypothetical protein
MSDEQEIGYKIFLSRLPIEWTDEHLRSHFELLFGPVLSANVITSERNQTSNFGYLIFENFQSKQDALEQKVIHAKKKTIHIRDYDEHSENNDGICYLWKRHACVRGDQCKFSHEGEGSCISTSAPGEGKKKCISFKSKGKCSKGDSCPFLHVAKSTPLGTSSSSSQEQKPKKTYLFTPETDEVKGNSGVCRSFVKKGKCRKGDNCRYLHELENQKRKPNASAETAEGDETPNGKRKRIDGQTLVENRKKMLLEAKQTSTGGESLV